MNTRSQIRDRCRIARMSGLALLAVCACSHRTELEPAESAQQISNEVAYTRVNDVTVLAKGDEWPGDPEVREHVTPVRVTIRNYSNLPIRIRYSRMKLVSDGGREYAALPPFRVPGQIEREVATYRPLFDYDRFAGERYYGTIYSGLPLTTRPYDIDPSHYGSYEEWQVRVDLPTRYMREVALPEGVVEPNGRLSGFVYFKHVPKDAERVNFELELVNADSGKPLGTATIPFTTG